MVFLAFSDTIDIAESAKLVENDNFVAPVTIETTEADEPGIAANEEESLTEPAETVADVDDESNKNYADQPNNENIQENPSAAAVDVTLPVVEQTTGTNETVPSSELPEASKVVSEIPGDVEPVKLVEPSLKEETITERSGYNLF